MSSAARSRITTARPVAFAFLATLEAIRLEVRSERTYLAAHPEASLLLAGVTQIKIAALEEAAQTIERYILAPH